MIANFSGCVQILSAPEDIARIKLLDHSPFELEFQLTVASIEPT